MLGALTILLLYQLLGEVLVQWFALPVPGPVLGMLLLLLTLIVRGGAPQSLRDTSASLLQHLSLLFVPAGAGVMVHMARIEGEWWPLVASLLGSTLLAMAVTALVLKWLLRHRGRAS